MSAALKAYRRHEGIGQEEMGSRLGCTGSYVSLLESGKRQLTADLASKLADLINVSGMKSSFSATEPIEDLERLAQTHRDNLRELFTNRIKLLEFELHKLEVKVATGKKNFTTAGTNYFVAQVQVTLGAGKLLPKTLMERQIELGEAFQEMRAICNTTPELVRGRIAGVKAEKAFLLSELKKLKRPALPGTGLPFDITERFIG